MNSTTGAAELPEALPRYREYMHLRTTGAWSSGVPAWARDYSGCMNDMTAAHAVIEELHAQVEALSAAQAGVPAEQTPELQRMTAHRAIYFMERFLKEEKLLGPNEQAALHFAIAMLAAAPTPPAQAADSVLEDATFEAVRKNLCALQRYSFCLDDDGVVRRVQDRTGNWIEFDDAHKLFDPVAVDAARKQGANHD